MTKTNTASFFFSFSDFIIVTILSRLISNCCRWFIVYDESRPRVRPLKPPSVLLPRRAQNLSSLVGDRSHPTTHRQWISLCGTTSRIEGVANKLKCSRLSIGIGQLYVSHLSFFFVCIVVAGRCFCIVFSCFFAHPTANNCLSQCAGLWFLYRTNWFCNCVVVIVRNIFIITIIITTIIIITTTIIIIVTFRYARQLMRTYDSDTTTL